jgi:hypothetical protein
VSKFFVKDHEMRRENETDGMRSRTDHYGMTILGDSVGANGCSPEEGAKIRWPFTVLWEERFFVPTLRVQVLG